MIDKDGPCSSDPKNAPPPVGGSENASTMPLLMPLARNVPFWVQHSTLFAYARRNLITINCSCGFVTPEGKFSGYRLRAPGSG